MNFRKDQAQLVSVSERFPTWKMIGKGPILGDCLIEVSLCEACNNSGNVLKRKPSMELG